MPRNSTCRSCPATVMWVQHERTHRFAPLDIAPDPNGRIVIEGSPGQQVYRLDDSIPRYTNHFITCPKGPSHRKKHKATA